MLFKVLNVKFKISSSSYKSSSVSKPERCVNLPNTFLVKFSLKYWPNEVCYALSKLKLLVALNFFHRKNFHWYNCLIN